MLTFMNPEASSEKEGDGPQPPPSDGYMAKNDINLPKSFGGGIYIPKLAIVLLNGLKTISIVCCIHLVVCMRN